MISVRVVVLGLFALNILAVFFIALNEVHPNFLKLQEIRFSKSPYSFDDPFVAHYLLEKLDIFEEVQDGQVPDAKYQSTAGGFKVNDNYCNLHRAYFISHPELVFEQQRFVTNYWANHKLRTQVIPALGAVDLYPDITPSGKYKDQYKYDLRVDANMFFTYNLFYYQRQLGKQFSCLSQASNHIIGHDKMCRKDMVGQALVDYAKGYASRPQCFNYSKYFPKTWLLTNALQCLDFFKEFNSPEYQKLKKERNIVYFRKIGANVHEGKGVFPVNDDEETKIRNLYKNGTLCGKVKYNNLIQYNVHNPLLVQNRKPGFRVFMLIASTNPVIAYFHDGYVRLSLNEYNPKSKEIKTFVTNIGVNLKENSTENDFGGMTKEQINEHTCWFYDRFLNYLLEEGLVTDTNWIENHLRKEFKKVMIHLIRMSQSGFYKKSSMFELLGLDFVMDENLDLWFIEANSMPLINGFTKDSAVQMNRMLSDTFEIVFGLLRSRMKRVILYINALGKEIDGLVIPDVEKKREEFRKITMNYFEPEFVPSPDNTFHKIIDENEVGTKRYAGLIDAKCL